MLLTTLARPVRAAALAAPLLLTPIPVEACTRCVYLGPANTVVVGRSMDWAQDPGTNIYCFPKGMQRNGSAGPNSIEWTSRYGSVVCSFYDVASVDGMNEKGLVVNMLYLVESDYGTPDGKTPLMSISLWAQYVLDNFASVDEAVHALRQKPFQIVAPVLPDGNPAQGHLSLSDPTGDSAILEYVDGELVIHHGREYQVMTNSPTFDKQLALDEYWKQIGGSVMLPGTNRAADRFARTSYYISSMKPIDNPQQAIASVFSIIRSASVPLGYSTPGQPNIASTIWRTAFDQKNRVMYFDSATSPSVLWVTLDELDFREGAPVTMLDVASGKTCAGESSAHFEETEPFRFLSADGK